MDPKKFFGELKRRNVIRAAIFYLGAVWALAQGISQLGSSLGAPEWLLRWFLVAAGIGFPFWIAFAWFYEFTPEGLKRESEIDPTKSITYHTGRKLDFAIIGVLAIAVVLLLTDRFVLRHGVNETTVAPISEKSIAVLPFENLSSDKENAYFADGVTDSLTTDLAQIHSLRVVSFQSARQFKGELSKSLSEVARALNVGAVIEGSVQQSGDTVMINAQLISAANDQNLWAARYTRKTRDLLDVQSEIVRAIADAVKIQLTPKEATRLAAERPVDPQAHSHYFLGRYYFGQGTETGLRSAIDEFEQAIANQPNFAAAYAGLASSYSLLSSYYTPPRETMPLADKAAHKAIELDPDNAEGHAAIGYIELFYHWHRDEAEREFQKAIELNPNYSTAYLNYALSLLTESRFDEALTQLRIGQRLEPTSAFISSQIEWALFVAGKYRDAVNQAIHTQSIEPRLSISSTQMGLAYLYLGEKDNALAALKKGVELDSSSFAVTSYAYALAVSGHKADAEKMLNEFLEHAKGKYVCAYEIASAYEGMNERAKALQWLQRGFDEKCDCLVWGMTEPWMGQLRRDPRYLAILAKAGLITDSNLSNQ